MFERFTDRARRTVVLAQEEARLLNHDYIGTEHLLLGLLREKDGVAGKALTAVGVSLDAARERVVEIIGQGQATPSGHIPFTPRAKKVLELALREALQLGHNYIGTEHILLGLIREGEGVAAQVLHELGADLDRVRQAVMELLSGYGVERRPVRRSRTRGQLAEEGLQAEVREQDPPVCPFCSTSLGDATIVRTIEAKTEGGETTALTIAYCGTCGSVLGIQPG